jgi:transcription antitermination factor NusG
MGGEILQIEFDRVQWYAAHTRANHEKEVLRHLQSRDIEAFLPLCVVRKRWNKQRVELHRPLFPGYLFVHIPLSERARVLAVSGVAHLVGSARSPSPILDREVAALIAGVNQNRFADPYPYLTAGSRVRIQSGPFADVEGFLLRRKLGCRVVVSIPQLCSSFSIEVDASEVEPINTGKTYTFRPARPLAS